MLVATVRAFIDRDVKPTVREVEHANTYPDAVDRADEADRHLRPGHSRGIRWVAGVDAVLCAGHPGTGARLDEPGRRDGRAHRGGQAADAVRHRGAEADLPAADGDRRAAGHHGADRARRRLGPAEHVDHRPARRPGSGSGDQRFQDLDQQRTPIRADRPAVQDRPERHAAAQGHLGRCSSSTGRA